jgi:predicted MFS family arabinose efflux permease
MGLLTAVGLLPSLVLSVPAGALIDRLGHRRAVMLISDLGRAGVLVAVPVAHAAHVLTLGWLYGAALVLGSFDVAFFVAYSTLFVAVVRPDQYEQGMSLLNGSRAFSFVAGQGLAGVLVAAVSAPVALLLDAFSFVCSAGALARIRPREPATSGAQDGGVLAGARFVRGSGVVRAALIGTATVNFFTFAFAALFILFATTELQVPPAQLGLTLGVGAVGGVVGSVLTRRISARVGLGPAFMASLVIFPAPLMLVPLARGPHALVVTLLALAELGSGFGVMILDITIGTIFSVVIPDVMRARVSGAYRAVNYGMRPLGAVTGGLLGTWMGLRPALWVATVGASLSVLGTARSPIRRIADVASAAAIGARSTSSGAGSSSGAARQVSGRTPAGGACDLDSRAVDVSGPVGRGPVPAPADTCDGYG